ncbi:MAG: hypothetical protein H0W52_15255 [Rubrobacteraceae bacterium]|nr:hypothetical protein [Rubrobacteraceae bacterium]
MSENKSEIARREEALAHAGEIVPGSGARGNPRRMARMMSVRLDGGLIGQLREVAQRRNTTVSDLLREGAELVVQDAYADTVTLKVTRSEGAVPTIYGGQATSGIAAPQSHPPEATTTTTRHRRQPTKV